jgi:hypothetical protein
MCTRFENHKISSRYVKLSVQTRDLEGSHKVVAAFKSAALVLPKKRPKK